jgi:aspartate kinase
VLEDIRLFHIQETTRLLHEDAPAFIKRRITPKINELHDLLIELEEGRKLTPQLQDQALSYGERLSSEIVAAAFGRLGMKTAHVSARDVIVTDNQFTRATPLYWETYAKLRRTVATIARESVVVMGGFIGATTNGIITTLGRGGSDLTASLLGAGSSAEEIQIWTDVDGILSCDPRVLRGGYRLRAISYEEAAEMARLGAKVLHPATVAPAIRQGIPISIRNSRHPDLEGTLISPRAARHSGIVKSIACQTDMAVIHLTVQRAAGLQVISDALNELFLRNGIAVHLVQARPDGVSFGVANSPLLPEVLRSVDESVRITVEEDMSVVSLVGEGIDSRPFIGGRAAAVLQDAGIRLMSQGSSRLSMSFAIPQPALAASIEKLHHEFFRSPAADLFAAAPESKRAIIAPGTVESRGTIPNGVLQPAV